MKASEKNLGLNNVNEKKVIEQEKEQDVGLRNDDTISQVEENEKSEEQEEEEKKAVDAAIDVTISEDKLNAYIEMEPPQNEGKAPTVNMIMQALMSKKVIYGINKDLLKEMEERPVYNHKFVVAQGKAPVDDKDAKLKFNFTVTKDLKPKIDENGTVDFREIGIVENIAAGQVLCVKTPVVKGEAGKAVTGLQLKPKKGKDLRLPVGKNTIASEDNLKVIADASGQVDYVGNRINVLDTFEVNESVGNKTGNIEFVGNVVVRGNVLSGFSVQAEGNVIIDGIVEAAHIKAGGNITINRGMNGMGKGILESGENINCKYMENSIVIAKGTIRAESMLNCQVRCGENLELIGRRGLLVGGSYVAGKNVDAKTIGSEAYAPTEIEIGKDPELYERLNCIHETIPNLKKELNDLDKIITYLQQLDSIGKLSSDKKELLNNASHTKKVKYKELNDLEIEHTELKEILAEQSKGKIMCSGKMYPGTKIAIGIAKMSINNVFTNCVASKKEDTIIIGAPK